MTPADNIAALGCVVAAFESLGVRYQVGGSVASSAHGIARSTLDVDVVAALAQGHVRGLVAALKADAYISEDAVRDAVARGGSFNIIHLATMIKVDVFILKTRRFDRIAFERGVDAALDTAPGARTFALASAEDVILHKLEWYQIGGGISERQWRDVIGVIEVQGPGLDRAYLREWAKDIGVSGLLERAFDTAEVDD